MKPNRSWLLDLVLALGPREFREGYRRDFGLGNSPPPVDFRDLWDLARTGLAMRLEFVGRDVKFAISSLAKARLFVVVAISTLALAISLNATVFGAINAVLLKPLPFSDADHLAFLCYRPAGSPPQMGTYCLQLDTGVIGKLRTQSRTLSGISGFTSEYSTLTGFGVPQSLAALAVSDNFFDVLKVRPQLGHFFSPTAAKPGVHSVVISATLWRRVFNSDPHIVGRTMVLDGVIQRVIGIVPAGTAMPIVGPVPAEDTIDVWQPQEASLFKSFGGTNDWVVARTMPGVSIGAVQADIDRVANQLGRQYPQERGLGVQSSGFSSWYYAKSRVFLYLALAVVFAVLLIACANLANLLLTRGLTRSGELAIRTAVGASRSRIIQQLIVEIALLTLCGGALGLLLAWLEMRALTALHSELVVPGIEQSTIDGRVAAFTFTVIVVSTLAAGVLPVMLSSRRNLNAELKSEGRGADRSATRAVRSALAVAQIALAFAVIIVSMLLYRSFATFAGSDLGIATKGVYWAFASLTAPRYADASRRLAFIQGTTGRIAALPGVDGVAIARPNPYLSAGTEGYGFRLAGRNYAPGMEPPAIITQITPAYFSVLQVPLISGREFKDADNAANSRAAIVDQHFAQLYFSGQNPIGERILVPDTNAVTANAPYLEATIVGEVHDIPIFGEHDQPRIYVPQAQFPSHLAIIFVRMRSPDQQLRYHIAAAVASVDSQEGLDRFDSLQNYIDVRQVTPRKVSALLIGMLAVVALLLALAGIYAIVSYSVEQRRREIGIRMAVGARSSQILVGVLGNALAYGAIGIAVGIVVSAGVTRFLAKLLFQTSPFDPLTFAIVSGLLAVCTILAAVIPAIRAAHLDPAAALRYE